MAQIPQVLSFKRQDNMNTHAVVNTSCRIGLLKDIHTTLMAKGGDSLVGRFCNGPFGHLITWRPGRMNSQVLHGILSRFLDTEEGVWFYIKGRFIEYTMADHALVTGLTFGAANYDPTVTRDPRNSELARLVCGGRPGTGKDLIARFKNLGSSIADPDGTIHLRVAQLLMADIFVLGHDAQKEPHSWLWELVENPQLFAQFPWGAYSYQTLKYYLERAQDSAEYHFYGPAWALYVWGLEVVPGLGDVAGIKNDQGRLPRCIHWKLKTRLTIDEPGLWRLLHEGVGDLPNIEPTVQESGSWYFQSLGDPARALEVRFKEPYNALTRRERIPTEVRLRRQRPPSPQPPSPQPPPPPPETSRRRRDTGSSDRAQQPEVSSSSSGGISESKFRRLERLIRQSKQELKDYIDVKYNELKEALSCGCSRRSTAAHEPIRRGSPVIIYSGRDSGVRGTQEEAHIPVLEPETSTYVQTAQEQAHIPVLQPETSTYVQTVGRRDTALPVYTAAEAGPSTTRYDADDHGGLVSQAFGSIFGQVTGVASPVPMGFIGIGTSHRASTSNIPDEPRYSMSVSLPGFAPFVSNPERYSMSELERDHSSGFSYCSAPTNVIPVGTEPLESKSNSRVESSYRDSASSDAVSSDSNAEGQTQPDVSNRRRRKPRPADIEVVRRWGQFMKSTPGTILLLDGGQDPLYVEDFLHILDMDREWTSRHVDLYMEVLRARLRNNDDVLAAHIGGATVICNCSFMEKLKEEYARVLQASRGMGWTRFEEIVSFCQDQARFGMDVLQIVHGVGVTYVAENWFNARSVLFPCYIQERFVIVRVALTEWHVWLFDPMWYGLDAGARKQVLRELRPLFFLLPVVLRQSYYYRHNRMGVQQSDAVFSNPKVPAKHDLFRRKRHSAVMACMTVERLISGCPQNRWGRRNVRNYKYLVAPKIFDLGKDQI